MDELLILQVLLGEFRDKLASLKNLIPRDVKFPDAPTKIKVAIGMRRVGKTYFLYQQILKMIENGIDKAGVLYINFEDDRLLPLNEQKLAKLVDAFYSLYPENHDRKCYLFFDEIQNVDSWPIVIRRLHDTKNVEIFLTGSSAKLLSKEIATNLRGRSLAIEIWPYSFQEFIRAKNVSIDRSLYTKKHRTSSHKCSMPICRKVDSRRLSLLILISSKKPCKNISMWRSIEISLKGAVSKIRPLSNT
ncbi:MAG: AAA family ATPase [Rhabdochlamydiaceae bacterium]